MTTSRNENDLHPALHELWDVLEPAAATELGVRIMLTCTYRSEAEQARLYAQGRTTPGLRVTNAKPGTSAHNVAPPEGSHALDFAVLNADGSVNWKDTAKYLAVASIARRLGADCGAFWKGFVDMPHIQMPSWKVGRRYGPAFRFVKHKTPPPVLAPKPVEVAGPAAPKGSIFVPDNQGTWIDLAGTRTEYRGVIINATDPDRVFIR